MAIIGGNLGYHLLKRMMPREAVAAQATAPTDSRLRFHFGDNFFDLIRGRTIIDFGCGAGMEAVEMARCGAAKVIGLDIQAGLLEQARSRAEAHYVSDRCTFASTTNERADIIISKDAFEHYADPEAIIRLMASLVKPDGFILASFGPIWLHPYGGHLFSVFPWAHLLFSEDSLIRWRSDFRTDGATRFCEVEGGLNQMTIRKFERIVDAGPCRIEWMDTVPIRGIQAFKHRSLREFGSSIVRCKMTIRGVDGS
jgi:SAM-dependent methyltransferase